MPSATAGCFVSLTDQVMKNPAAGLLLQAACCEGAAGCHALGLGLGIVMCSQSTVRCPSGTCPHSEHSVMAALVCVWRGHGSGGRVNGVSLRPSLLRIRREDLVGSTATLLSKVCLEVVLVFSRGGTRRRQTDKDMAQHPEAAGPAVRELWNLMPEQIWWPQSTQK